MKSSYPLPEQVLSELGDKVVDGLALMVAQTREDLKVYRSIFPGWVADSSERGLLNWCHDRLWAHAGRIFDGSTEVRLIDRPPLREILVGITYRLRVKKHDVEGRVSTYLTQGALDFLEQELSTLEGLEEVRLITGYRWDAEERVLGSAVISMRDGLDNVIWMRDLDEPASGAVTTVRPIVPPGMPQSPKIGRVSESSRTPGTQKTP